MGVTVPFSSICPVAATLYPRSTLRPSFSITSSANASPAEGPPTFPESIDTSKYGEQLFTAIDPVRVATEKEAIEKVKSGDVLGALVLPPDLTQILKKQPRRTEWVFPNRNSRQLTHLLRRLKTIADRAGVAAVDLDAGAVVGLVAASRQPHAEHARPRLLDLVSAAHELRDRDLASREIHDVDPLVGREVRGHHDTGVIAALLRRRDVRAVLTDAVHPAPRVHETERRAEGAEPLPGEGDPRCPGQ